MQSLGSFETAYSYTGEMIDLSGLVYLRARYYDPATGRFVSRDTWEGESQNPISINNWLYAYANPIKFIDPFGNKPSCPIGDWDCEAVQNTWKLRKYFIESASRHNNIPGMDNTGFAALLASVIVSERRIGNVPPDSDPRNRKSQKIEDLLASFGCTVSGRYLKDAMNSRDVNQLLRYFLNLDVPQRATVGIGNDWLETAANLWKGQACDSLGNCKPVSVSKMQTKNLFGQTIDIGNPFGSQLSCVMGMCTTYLPNETGSYVQMTSQLLDWKMNIEYVATNLEAGALRANAMGYKPTAFNSATWHLRGLQTDQEIEESLWNPGGALWIVDHVFTALNAMELKSTWNLAAEVQYAKYK